MDVYLESLFGPPKQDGFIFSSVALSKQVDIRIGPGKQSGESDSEAASARNGQFGPSGPGHRTQWHGEPQAWAA